MDRRISGHGGRRYVQAALVRSIGPQRDRAHCMQKTHSRRLPTWTKLGHKTPRQDNSMSHGCNDVRLRSSAGASLDPTNPSNMPARRGVGHGCRTRGEHADRMPGEARVYPQHGLFLNPVAFSNIETYRMTHGRSGTTPRSFLLRSSLGTPLTMQPISKPAQSMYTKPLRDGTRARSSR